MAYLRLQRNRSQLTVEAYARDLQEFGAFLAHADPKETPVGKPYPQLRRVTTAEVQDYIMYLSGKRKCDSRTIRRKLSSIKALYKYMKLSKLRKDDPAAIVPGPSMEKKYPKHLDLPQISLLLRTSIAGRSEFQRLRDRAIMELLYASGIRRAELANIDLHDLNLPKGLLHVHGKGRKERDVLLNRAAARALAAYLRIRPRTSDPAFFVGRGRKRLTPKHIWRIFRDIYKVSKMEYHASPHTFRHSFGTHMAEGGADLEVIRELLGHESLATTGIYLHLATKRKRRVYDKAHPRDRMDI